MAELNENALDYEESESLIKDDDNVEDIETKEEDNGDSIDLDVFKLRAKEMEDETAKLKELQVEIEKHSRGEPSDFQSPIEDVEQSDARSIYIGNVDYEATAEELERHFLGCGAVNRVTILANKYTGHPKGFAYIEFADLDSVSVALAMDESLFRGRLIKVSAKRTNRPGIYSATNRPPRGYYRRPYRGRGYEMRGYGRRFRNARWVSPYSY
uniref:RRM domain-containing protein n=1 Tax=Strigamia maritima TaxID=126957 RepID=T1IHZ0_STRMM